MWRGVLLVGAVVVGVAAVAGVGSAASGCAYDHTAIAENRSVEVDVCGSLGNQVGEYSRVVLEPDGVPITYGNQTVRPGERVVVERIAISTAAWAPARTYLHELAHAEGYEHGSDDGVFRAIASSDVGTPCRPSAAVEAIAANWSTVSVDRSGVCHVVETPFGSVSDRERAQRGKPTPFVFDWLPSQVWPIFLPYQVFPPS